MEYPWIKTTSHNNILAIRAGGSWNAYSINSVDSVLREIDLKNIKNIELNIEDIHNMDISGAWPLTRLIRRAKNHNITTNTIYKNSKIQNIFEQIEQIPIVSMTKKLSHPAKKSKDFKNLFLFVEFLGQFSISLAKVILNPRKLRLIPFVATFNQAGVNAIFIVSVISFLIGIVLAYQGSFQLTKFGAEIYTVDLLAISLFREIGILLTAIMVAGRSASAYAAQIGSMKINQEIDALQTFKLDPMEIIVLPRVLSLMIALPMLAFVSDIIGLIGGALICYTTLDINFSQFINQLNKSFSPWSFWVGIIKAPFFGFMIAFIGCFEGMQVKGTSQGLGEKTTKAVVESIFCVIVLDAIFSIIFTALGI